MKSYKDFDKIIIGYSDIASLILVGCDSDGKIITSPLNFGEDGCYSAYFVTSADAQIGEHYKPAGEFSYWLRIYDDEGLVRVFKCRNGKIKVYRAGEYSCIVQITE